MKADAKMIAPHLELKEGLGVLKATTPVQAHGAAIPILGLGTWQLEGDTASKMVETALTIGYRHIDTAQAYENEEAVGQGLEASGVPRGEIFVTTKVWPENYGEETFLGSVESSLEKLGLESVDLLLLHWPKFEGTDLEATIGRLNEVRKRGLARHIGVSNFTTALLEAAWEASDAPLVANQVEYHPFLDQTAVLGQAQERGMALTAYSPIARGGVGDSAPLEEIGRRHGKSAVQVSLRWLIQQKGLVAIPKTSSEDHCRENFQIFDFQLSPAEMEMIGNLARREGRIIDPDDLAPEWD